MYKPNGVFSTPAQILIGHYEKINGIVTKYFTDGEKINVLAKSYGGTEKIINDRYVIEDTMVIETWFRKDITVDGGVRLLDDNSEWEIINSPENIDRRNKFLRFKVKRIKGKV